MHVTVERYYKINRVFLKFLGIWPYQQSCFTRIRRVLFASVLLTFILVQLLVFVTTQFDANLLLKILSFVCPILFVTIKYCIFIMQIDTVKEMLEEMRNDWRSLKDKLEVDIIEKYAYKVQVSCLIAIVVGCFTMLTSLIFQCFPLIFDVILPLNESRPFRLLVMTEYFINEKKYIYIMLLHEILACTIALVALYGTFITIMTYIWHVCALFKIARFVKLIASNYTVLFTFLIIVGVSSLSINLFQVTLENSNMEDTCIAILLIIIHLSYMFIVNYGGQKITDHGVELFNATYNGPWYLAPLHTQKLLLFIMQKGHNNVTLIFGGLYVVSLEGFASLTNAAVSYFMMMHSTRK